MNARQPRQSRSGFILRHHWIERERGHYSPIKVGGRLLVRVSASAWLACLLIPQLCISLHWDKTILPSLFSVWPSFPPSPSCCTNWLSGCRPTAASIMNEGRVYRWHNDTFSRTTVSLVFPGRQIIPCSHYPCTAAIWFCWQYHSGTILSHSRVFVRSQCYQRSTMTVGVCPLWDSNPRKVSGPTLILFNLHELLTSIDWNISVVLVPCQQPLIFVA